MKSVLLTLFTLCLAASAICSAQQPTDIVGITTGMPMEEAIKKLQAHNPDLKITVNPVKFRELPDKPSPFEVYAETPDKLERLSLELSLPPEPPVVMSVLRWTRLPDGKHPPKEKIIQSLKQKYGDSGYLLTIGPNNALVWHADPEKRRNFEADKKAGNSVSIGCATRLGFTDYVLGKSTSAEVLAGSTQDFKVPYLLRYCGKFVEARTESSNADKDLVSLVIVAASDEELRVVRTKKTAEWLAQVSKQAKEKQINDANQNAAPKF